MTPTLVEFMDCCSDPWYNQMSCGQSDILTSTEFAVAKLCLLDNRRQWVNCYNTKKKAFRKMKKILKQKED